MKTILNKYSSKTSAQLADAFDALALPIPHQGEFRKGHSTVVFLNAVGLTLRLQPRATMPLLRHTHLLRPLGSVIVNDDLRIDITQGGKTATSEKTSNAVYNKLKADGIGTDDIKNKPQNSLLLKAVNIEFPEGIPAAYDPYVLKCYSHKIREFGDSLYDGNVIDLLPIKGEEPDVQDEIYGELRQQFQGCVSPDTGKIEPEKLAAFYQSCKQFKAAGFLAAPWERGFKLPFSITRKSAKYAAHIARHASSLRHDLEI